MPKNRCYLDFNATTPLLNNVKESMIAALDVYGNPSSVHQEGRMAKAAIQDARRKVASLVNASPDNVIFTSGASESAHFALTPYYQMGRSDLRISHLYYNSTEHPCILNGGHFSASERTSIPVQKNGLLNLEDLKQKLHSHDISKGIPLVAVQAANPETGVIQPLKEIATITREAGGLMLVDLVQYVGKMPIDIKQDIGDFFIYSAHKIGGPKGVGAFISASDIIMPKPLLRAGGQEKGHRGGTEAFILIVGFGEAAKNTVDAYNQENHLKQLQEKLELGIEKMVPDAIIYGKDAPRLPNTTYFTVPNIPAETMQISFDLAGFAVSAGSACSSGKTTLSPVLKAMGFEHNNGALRVSTGVTTTPEDIDRFLEELEKLVNRRKNKNHTCQVV